MTSLPGEAACHADAIFLGPGEQTFPRFLEDFRRGAPSARYASTSGRTIEGLPPVRRDLIKRSRYLVPNSVVVTRGCPQHCDFHAGANHRAKHFFYAAGWKKFEPLWDVVINARRLRVMTPVLEAVLSKVSASRTAEASAERAAGDADSARMREA